MPARGGASSRGSTVAIPVGVWGDGPKPLRELTLRPVDAEDEVFLLDAAEALGPIRILVNNAGIQYVARVPPSAFRNAA